MKRLAATVAIATALTVTPTPAHVDAVAYGRCPQYEPALRYAAGYTGWSVSRMSYVMWRESRCIATVENVGSTSVATGVLQVHSVNWPWLSRKVGVPLWRMRTWLKHPINNIAAGALLSRYSLHAWGDRYRPWRVFQ